MITPGRPVKDVEINEQTSLEKIFEELSQSGGFEAVNLSSSLDILSEMIKDEKCLKFVSFVGAVVSTCLLYTSPSPRDVEESRMPSSA